MFFSFFFFSKVSALWNLNENTRDYITLNGFDQNLKDTIFFRQKGNVQK